MPKPVDAGMMRRAVALSKKGFPAPNPHVGCVITAENRIVGEGFHAYAGAPHAEVMALVSAGDSARGADAYVTLAPCNHHGRTPPCSLALIAAGVRRVVIAVDDPNPMASGGIARLLDAGIEVELGLLADRAEDANRQFLFATRNGKTYVIGKAATSMDGRIALPSGESKWITGAKARAAAHRLRAECGAVLVGRRTVEMDDPQLTARIEGVVNQPLRIVIDPSNRLGTHHRIFDDQAETWHVTGQIDLEDLMARVFESGRTGLLVEGGAKTMAHFLKSGLIEEFRLFVAPRILGDGPTWIEGLALESLSASPQFQFAHMNAYGADREMCWRRVPAKLDANPDVQ